MGTVRKSDLRQIDYAEFGVLLGTLTEKVRRSGVEFDLIVPTLRSGGFTGLHIASQLKIQNILPAQYKYEYKPHVRIQKKFDFPELHFALPDEAAILVADTNTVGGKIADKVIDDVHICFPAARIYFASAVLDISYAPAVQDVFFAKRSNEARTMSDQQAAKSGISSEITIFPWENLEEEWQNIKTLPHTSN